MRKYHKWIAVISSLIYTTSIAMAIEGNYLIAAILAPLSFVFMIGAVYVQRIYIKRLKEEEQS